MSETNSTIITAPEVAPQVRPDGQPLKVEPPKNTLPTNWLDLALKKVEEVKAFYSKFAGNIGCNPYFYYNEVIKPVEDKLKAFSSTFKHVKVVVGEYEKPKEIPISKEEAANLLYSTTMALETNPDFAMHSKEAYDQEVQRQKNVVKAKLRGEKQIIIQ